MLQDKDKSAQSGYLIYFGDRIKKIAVETKDFSAARQNEVSARQQTEECDFSRDTSSWD